MGVLALDSALSGLRSAQAQLSVISSNISNVSTPGYSRKILPQSARVAAGETIGVQSDRIIRNVDVSISRDLWTQVSSTSSLTTRSAYLSQIQNFHGAPEAKVSLAAEIAALKDSFSNLSDSPEDGFRLGETLRQAGDVVDKFNDFGKLIQQLRNDAEDEISTIATRVNDRLAQIADLNGQIRTAANLGRSTAALEDLRDGAVKSIAEDLEVSTFRRGDGVLVVQTKTGVQLADERVTTVYFEKTNLGPGNYYPLNVNGFYVGGNPDEVPTAIDVTKSALGGRLGQLLELRDNTLPQYQAQIDEAAFRTAQRFESQGLRLFTNSSGTLPADNPPVPNPPGPLTSVPYVGFAQEIQLNTNVVTDPTLLRSGTTGASVQSGSSEVIRRVLEFAFGDIQSQQITSQNNPAIPGIPDLRVSLNGAASDTLQENFGLFSNNQVLGNRNLSQYITDINLASGNPFTATTDDFTLRFFDTRLGLDTGAVTIDLSVAAAAFPIGGPITDAADQLTTYINSLVWPAGLAVTASVSPNGQLLIESRGNIEIGAGTAGTDGLTFLGLSAGTATTKDPYFDIQVGNDPAQRITIEPGDDETDLIAKIEAVTGIGVGNVTISALTGGITIRPANGGDIRITGGPFTSDPAAPNAVGNINIVQELFGVPNPVQDIGHPAFRTSQLGAGVDISTGIVGSLSLIDFGQKIVNVQSQDKALADAQLKDEDAYRATLETQLNNQSGVNIDEELSNLIIVQTAYSASARAVTAVSDLFQELLDSIR